MTAFTVENVDAFFERSNQFVQDDHNWQLLRVYIDHCTRQGQELSIENLAAYIKQNAKEFHWLRSEEELAAVRSAATPPEPEKPKLQGSVAEKLWQVGVEPTKHVSHAQREELDRKQESVLQTMAKEAGQVRTNLERQEKINEARSIVIYRLGRVDHGATADERRKALAALGIME